MTTPAHSAERAPVTEDAVILAALTRYAKGYKP